ncbi:uncharacterized protein VTP21DRAFT_1474 [Calcarisporiella thermophila]|uniref:uncharacterized protein n=1 Tax=Calcarisporiella thermophila TaxID=911321 RepID=UPI00374344BE
MNTGSLWQQTANLLLTSLENLLHNEGLAELPTYSRPPPPLAQTYVIDNEKSLHTNNRIQKRKRGESEGEEIVKSRKISQMLSCRLASLLQVTNENASKTVEMESNEEAKEKEHAMQNVIRKVRRFRWSLDTSVNSNIHSNRIALVRRLVKGENMQTFSEGEGKSLEQLMSSLFDARIRAIDEVRSGVDGLLEEMIRVTKNGAIPLANVFPKWSNYQRGFVKLIEYIEIIQDMSTTISSPIYNNSSDIDIQSARELLDRKRALYGDVLSQKGLSLKAHGLAVDASIFEAVQQWVHGILEQVVSRMQQEAQWCESVIEGGELDVQDSRIVKVMDSVLDVVQLVFDSCEFAALPSDNFLHIILELVAIHCRWAARLVSRVNEVRVMHRLENATHLVEYIESLQSICNTNVNGWEALANGLVELGVRSSAIFATLRTKTSSASGRKFAIGGMGGGIGGGGVGAYASIHLLEHLVRFVVRVIGLSSSRESNESNKESEARVRRILLALNQVEDIGFL